VVIPFGWDKSAAANNRNHSFSILFSFLIPSKDDSFLFDNSYTQNLVMADSIETYNEYPKPLGRLLGFHFSACHHGQSFCHVDITASLLNLNGVVHGPIIYALANIGMGGSLLDQNKHG
jgi:hypothetical protein